MFIVSGDGSLCGYDGDMPVPDAGDMLYWPMQKYACEKSDYMGVKCRNYVLLWNCADKCTVAAGELDTDSVGCHTFEPRLLESNMVEVVDMEVAADYAASTMTHC